MRNRFLDCLLDNCDIRPQLICSDSALIANIKLHPAIQWSIQDKNQLCFHIRIEYH